MATTLALPIGRDGGDTLVEVAVDAPAGPGPRTYTYAVPAALGSLEPGEPVLVPFGRGGRQAIGIVVGPGSRRSSRAAPSSGRSRRGSGATVRCCRRCRCASRRRSRTATSPRSATVIRAMLPPGMLERLELVAEVTPAGEARLGRAEPGLDAVDLDLLDELAGRPRPVRDLSTPEGRAGAAPAAPGARRRGPGRPRPGPCSGRPSGRATSGACGSRPRGGRGRASWPPGSACRGGRSGHARSRLALAPELAAAGGDGAAARRDWRPGRAARGTPRGIVARRARPPGARSAPRSASDRGGRWPAGPQASAAPGRPVRA